MAHKSPTSMGSTVRTGPGTCPVRQVTSDKCSVMAEKGIVGRGVLLDYHKWRLANNIPLNVFKREAIPLEHLLATAESQGVKFKFGDILFVRIGGSPTDNSW